MLSDAFESIRRRHPEEADLLTRLQGVVEGITASPAAVVDERSVAQILGVPRERIEPLLIELVQQECLRTEFFWVCPTNGGTAWHGSELAGAPSWLHCPDCLQGHFFSEQDVEVHFLKNSTHTNEAR